MCGLHLNNTDIQLLGGGILTLVAFIDRSQQRLVSDNTQLALKPKQKLSYGNQFKRAENLTDAFNSTREILP